MLFSVLWCLVKVLSERYPVNEVTFFRNFFGLVPVLVMIAMSSGRRLLHAHRLAGHVWRSVIGVTSMMLGFWSYHLMPLADAVAISFAAPLMVTALSVPLLRERVGIHRWTAVIVGFGGVLVIVEPSSQVFSIAALVAISAAFAASLAMVTVRQLNRIDQPLTIVFYFTLLSTLFTALPLPFSWITPTPTDWGLAMLMGLVGGIGQYFMTRAFALAPAALVSPFNYVGLLWATGFGWLVWGDIPAPHVFVGSLIVVASGLYILYREIRKVSQIKPRISQT
jgi:drug/metabolite transporter (DMT)-like permease